MSENSFTQWYLNNKDSNEICEDYREYRNETKTSTGGKPLGKRAWAKERWQALQEICTH